MKTTKEEPLSFVLFESPFASVLTVSRGHPSSISLTMTIGHLKQEKLPGVLRNKMPRNENVSKKIEHAEKKENVFFLCFFLFI
jgi:hypothetical protein